MKITKWALSVAVAASCLGGSVFAQAPAENDFSDYYADSAAPVVSKADLADYSSVIPASCGCSESPISDCCDTGCSDPCDIGCDSGCDSGGLGLCGGGSGLDIGGWLSLGYHNYNNSLFNQHADRVRLNQAWLYAEKVADGSDGIGFGGRIDYVYGVDAQDTQAFGIANGHWDEGWDNGIYGHAIPQLYGQVAFGDVSVIAGHFYTLIGYEVVGAPGNFFYSHSYTMYRSEPFTHTGVLATYEANDTTTLYGGWVMGWDSGFEDNGDAFLGGYSVDVTDSFNVTNQYVVGRFGEGANSEVGLMTSSIYTTKLSDAVTHVLWIDFLDTDSGANRAVERETLDINNYLLVSLTDNVTWGNRFEYYNIDDRMGGHNDIYQFTTGFNLGLSENLLLRPEVRWDWDKDSTGVAATSPAGLELGSSQTTFGGDMILTF
ncbi:MAG: outer membrane beta-barrel protein [Planctomycetota bacterium]